MTGKITSKPVPDITFTKVNKDTGSKVSNAKFVLYKGNSTTPYDDGKGVVKLSNSNGEFGWANLEDGSYSVIEVEAPEGYELVNNQKVASFTVSNGTITNKSIAYAYNRNGDIANKSYAPTTSEFSFKKVNSVDNSPLKGAQFILENTTSGGTFRSNETLADGIVRFKDIPDGTYVLKETKRPNDAGGKTYNEVPLNKALATISFADGTYQISNASESFKQLKAGIVVTNAPDVYRGKFKIKKTKVDENGKSDFQNVEFTLTNKSTNQQKSATTNQSGELVFDNLDIGSKWTLTENTPDGYVDYKYKWDVEVYDGGVRVTLVSESAKNSGLTQTDTNKEPTITVINKKSVVVKVKKVDSKTKEPLEGVVLGLYKNKSDDTPIGEATTNTSGIATFSDIPIGENLYVKEIKGLDNYKSELVNMDTNQVEDIIVNTSQENNYIVSGDVTPISKKIGSTKTSPPEVKMLLKEYGKDFEYGLRFLIKTTSDPQEFKIANMTSDNTNINESRYTFREVTESDYRDYLSKNNSGYENTNLSPLSQREGNLSSLPIKDDNGRNVRYIQDSNTRKGNRYFILDIDNISFKRVVSPRYNTDQSQESKILLDITEYQAGIKQRGQYEAGISVSFTNTPTITVGNEPLDEKGRFTLNKVNDSQRPIVENPAYFTLQSKTNSKYYDNEGNEFSSEKEKIVATSSETGQIVWENIPNGIYTLVEVQQPIGHYKTYSKWEVKVENGRTTITTKEDDYDKNRVIHTVVQDKDNTTLNVVNEEIKGKIEFIKYAKDVNGNTTSIPLEGAVFELYKKADNGDFQSTGKEYISGNDGKINIEKLTQGDYQLVETRAPEGYKITQNPVKKFRVDEGVAKIKSTLNYTTPSPYNDDLKIYNEKGGKGIIKVYKKDENEKPIKQSGAKFQLFDEKGTNVGTEPTNDQGIAEFTGLEYGTYKLKEIASPQGYILDPTERTVVLEKYEKPTNISNPKDVSDLLNITNYSIIPTKSSDRNKVSTQLYYDNNYIYPNATEALRTSITYSVNEASSKEIQPGDTFYQRLNNTVDLDGIGNAQHNANRGLYDIKNGDQIVATAEVIGKRIIKYTFTDYVKYNDVNTINMTFPMYIDRYEVPNDENNVYIEIDLGYMDGNSFYGRSEKAYRSITVDYDRLYSPDWNNITSFTYKLSRDDNRFVQIAYVNSKGLNTFNREFIFTPKQDVMLDSVRYYKTNNPKSLPKSFAIDNRNLDFRNLAGRYGLIADGYDTRKRVDANANFNPRLGGQDTWDSSTYVVVIEGRVLESNPTVFETTSKVKTYSNYYMNNFGQNVRDTYQDYYWKNYSRFFQPSANSSVTPTPSNPVCVGIEVVNKLNRVEFVKKDGETNKPLKGATFKLVRTSGERLTDQMLLDIINEEKTSGENGKFYWEGIPDGSYEVQEISAPDGYEQVNNKVVAKFTVKNGKISNSNDTTSDIYNYKKKIYGKFKLLKVKEDDKALDGVVFELKDKYGKEVQTKTSENGGKIIFDGLSSGRYTLEEKEANSGYIKTNQTWSVQVDENGRTTVTPIVQTTDENNIEIDKIENLSKDDLARLNSNGFLIANTLANGDAAEGKLTTIKVVNRKPTYPSTGGDGTKITFALIGTAIMITAIAYFGMISSNKNRRRSVR